MFSFSIFPSIHVYVPPFTARMWNIILSGSRLQKEWQFMQLSPVLSFVMIGVCSKVSRLRW